MHTNFMDTVYICMPIIYKSQVYVNVKMLPVKMNCNLSMIFFNKS